MHLLSPKEAFDLCPILSLDKLVGAAWIPSDGYAEPSSLTAALAAGARKRGVRIFRGVDVTGAKSQRGRITELTYTTKHGSGSIKCNKIVNAGGIFARELGERLGMRVPSLNVQHQYLVTGPLPNLPPNLPTLRDPDRLIYYKPEVKGMVMGGWEEGTHAVHLPHNFGPQLYTPNFDRFAVLAEGAALCTPIFEKAGVKLLVNGPIPVSADGEPIMGVVPEYENAFVAAGFTAGVGAAGGAGRMMAEWVSEGAPSLDLWPLDVRRFGVHHNSTRFLEARTVEVYGSYYKLHPPGVELKSGRPLRTSPLYQTLKDKGAVYGSKFGWERPNWFAINGHESVERPSFNRPNWFDAVGAEHKAVRERVALIDQSSFAKLEVWGPNALSALQRVAVNDLSGPPGTVVYTQLCNERGGVESDVTIARISEDRFYITTGSAFALRDFGWIERHLPRSVDGSLNGVSVREVTNAYAVINVCGPLSRKLLEATGVEQDISNAEFPFMQWRQLNIAGCPVRALRVTFVGELGYELHVPVEFALTLYEHLWKTGQGTQFSVVNAGYKCIESLRLEKGYRVWGSDLTPDTNPYEAGLGFCVKLDKPGGFIGREALLKVKQAGPERKLLCFTMADLLDKDILLEGKETPSSIAAASSSTQPLTIMGNEPILHKGKVVGSTTSAGFGYTVGKTILYGYVPAALAESQEFELQAYGKTVPITRQPNNRALVDWKREKLLA